MHSLENGIYCIDYTVKCPLDPRTPQKVYIYYTLTNGVISNIKFNGCDRNYHNCTVCLECSKKHLDTFTQDLQDTQ